MDEVKNEVYFDSPVLTFDIQIDKELIFELSNGYTELKSFAERVRKGEKASLHSEFAANSFKSMLLIVRIKKLLEEGAGKSPIVKELAMHEQQILV
ncbi:MAG: hypothetical protein PW786_04940 [Arachidicoccus sp.]|nr:hypothetical protein [Arachidicoccus sp.]